MSVVARIVRGWPVYRRHFPSHRAEVRTELPTVVNRIQDELPQQHVSWCGHHEVFTRVEVA